MFENVLHIADGKQKEIAGNLLLFSMLALETAYLYSAAPITLIIAGILGGCTLLYVLRRNGPARLFMIGLAAGIVALVTVNRLLVLNCGWSGCLRIVFISLPIAYLLCHVRINTAAALSFFYAVFLFTVVMISRSDSAHLYRIFAASSRNYISVLLIACLFPYYLACARSHTPVSIFPALLSLSVSIYVRSRGGVLASGILYGLTFIREICRGTVKGAFKNKRILLHFLISTALFLVILYFTAAHSDTYLSRFSGSEEYPITRLDMWKEYLTVTGSSLRHLILGPPLTACPLITAEAYNSHNSYLMTHSYMGIAGFLAVVAGGVGYLILCFRKKHYDLLFLSLTFLFRAMTDYLFPMLFCDCIVLLMILEAGRGGMKVAYEQLQQKNPDHCDPCV